jgi:hypothetical protein
MLKKLYFSGCAITALVFATQVKNEGPVMYALSVASWPISVLLAVHYIRYVAWNSILHRHMVLNRLGFYENMSDEEYEAVLAICDYKRLLRRR